jgi:DNA-binding IclR family transcriptional regulator
LDLRVFSRKGVLEVLDLLSDNSEGFVFGELREKAHVNEFTLRSLMRFLRDNGLVELSARGGCLTRGPSQA